MPKILPELLILALATSPVSAQKIESEIPSRERVVRVQTAMNHLTVIEVPEPISTVALGSPQAFKVERRDNKVLIQPLQENVATNLFIWTATMRLNYELVPAIADPGEMDFAIDYPQPQRRAAVSKPPEPAKDAQSIPGDMLLKATPVHLAGSFSAEKSNLGIVIRDIFRKQDAVFVRYSIENHSDQVLRVGEPTIASLTGIQFDRSLWALQNSQLGPELITRLKSRGAAVPIRVMHCEPDVAEVAPGATQLGFVVFDIPSLPSDKRKAQPTVLQFQFPTDQALHLSATFVL